MELFEKEKIREVIANGENFTTEFKQEFDWNSKEKKMKYIKAMAGLCNNNGGYLIFGVENTTNGIIGIDEGFQNLDKVEITKILNQYFQPTIIYDWDVMQESGKTIGLIYIFKRKGIPSVCKKEFRSDNNKVILDESDIYYRYHSETRKIHFGDFLQMLNELKQTEELKFHKQTRKVENQPNLRAGPMYSDNQITVRITNNGKEAIIKKLEQLPNNTVFFGLELKKAEGYRLGTGGVMNIIGFTQAVATYSVYEIKVIYTDKYGQYYYQDFYGSGVSSKFTSTNPKEFEPDPKYFQEI